MKKKSKLSRIKNILVAIFLVGIVLFYFNYLSNKTAERRTDSEKKELAELLDYNMSLDYPNTPRDVVKLHNRYLKLMYGLKLSDKEIEGLGSKICQLYCEELLEINPESVMTDQLKSNIKQMSDDGYEYKSYLLPEASQINKYTRDGREMASMEVTITIGTDDGIAYRYVTYVLIKENEQWKIYGWGDS